MRPRTAILVAVAVYFAISWFVPFGTTLLYPLTLFTTWVHEMGHGLTGLLMGGPFKELVIRGDASVAFGSAVELMSIARRAGAKSINILTQSGK